MPRGGAQRRLLVLEISSFQLHYLQSPGFEVAALLNVRPDHLNWHDSFEEYAGDKLRIFEGRGRRPRAGERRGPRGRGAADSLAAEVLVVGRGDTAVGTGACSCRGS